MARLFGFPPREVDNMKKRTVDALEICARLDAERQRYKQRLEEFYASRN